MKVYLNLSQTPTPRERYALAWAIPTIAVSLIVLVWLASTAIGDFERSREIHRSLAEAQNHDTQLLTRERKLQQELGRPEIRQMVHETEFVNGLIDLKEFSLTDLTVKVGKLLPPAVRLTGLGLSAAQATPIVQFSVMGKDEDSIESFLENLENSEDFSDVIVKSQGIRQAGAEPGSQLIAVVCTARYVTGFSPSGK